MSINPEAFFGRGTGAIIAERAHQVDLGYTIKHDLEGHSSEELLRAGACYIDFAAGQKEDMAQDEPHPFWPTDTDLPWKDEGWMGNAIKGAAYIAAAIDLDYAEASQDE